DRIVPQDKERNSMKPSIRTIVFVAACAVLCAGQQPPERAIPARTIPVPTTVSPEMQQLIAPAWSGSKSPVTLTSERWKALQTQRDSDAAKALQPVKQKFHVSVQEERIAGVRVYRVKPQAIAPENRNR